MTKKSKSRLKLQLKNHIIYFRSISSNSPTLRKRNTKQKNLKKSIQTHVKDNCLMRHNQKCWSFIVKRFRTPVLRISFKICWSLRDLTDKSKNSNSSWTSSKQIIKKWKLKKEVLIRAQIKTQEAVIRFLYKKLL